MIEVRLDDLITLQRGFDITEKVQEDGPFAVISSGGISSFHNEYKVGGPGVVIGRKGTLGKVFYTNQNYWPHDTSLWVKDFKGNDPKFIYYLLQLLHFEKFDAGAANPTLNRNHIHSLKLLVPIKEHRSKIASILFAYDELIENNKQRIKLLEEMAEEIYKERFVRFRSSGNEFAKGKNDIPDNWRMIRLGDYFDISLGGTPSRENESYWKGDVPWINSGKVNDLRVTEPSEYITELGLKNSATKLLPKKTTLLAITGATLGQVSFLEIESCTNQSVVGIKDPNDKIDEYIFLAIKEKIKELVNYAGGGAQQHINKAIVEDAEIILADDQTMNKFIQIIKPHFDLISNLIFKNQLLQQTRDLLLSRLISGKLSVGHLIDKEPESLSLAGEPELAYRK